MAVSPTEAAEEAEIVRWLEAELGRVADRVQRWQVPAVESAFGITRTVIAVSALAIVATVMAAWAGGEAVRAQAGPLRQAWWGFAWAIFLALLAHGAAAGVQGQRQTVFRRMRRMIDDGILPPKRKRSDLEAEIARTERTLVRAVGVLQSIQRALLNLSIAAFLVSIYLVIRFGTVLLPR